MEFMFWVLPYDWEGLEMMPHPCIHWRHTYNRVKIIFTRASVRNVLLTHIEINSFILILFKRSAHTLIAVSRSAQIIRKNRQTHIFVYTYVVSCWLLLLRFRILFYVSTQWKTLRFAYFRRRPAYLR